MGLTNPNGESIRSMDQTGTTFGNRSTRSLFCNDTKAYELYRPLFIHHNLLFSMTMIPELHEHLTLMASCLRSIWKRHDTEFIIVCHCLGESIPVASSRERDTRLETQYAALRHLRPYPPLVSIGTAQISGF